MRSKNNRSHSAIGVSPQNSADDDLQQTDRFHMKRFTLFSHSLSAAYNEITTKPKSIKIFAHFI